MINNRTELLPRQLRSWASILIVVHLGLFVTTLSTSVLDWNVRDRLVDIATPYTAAIHLELGGRTLADASHTIADWPHRLQYRMPNEADWQDFDPLTGRNQVRIPGFGTTARYERYLTTIAEAAQREDTATAAMLAEPLVAALMSKLRSQSPTPPTSAQSGVAADHPDENAGRQFFQLRVVAREPAGPIGEQADAKLPSVALAADVLPVDFDVTDTVRWQAGVVTKPKLTDASENGWSVVYLEEDRLNAKAVNLDRSRTDASVSLN